MEMYVTLGCLGMISISNFFFSLYIFLFNCATQLRLQNFFFFFLTKIKITYKMPPCIGYATFSVFGTPLLGIYEVIGGL